MNWLSLIGGVVLGGLLVLGLIWYAFYKWWTQS